MIIQPTKLEHFQHFAIGEEVLVRDYPKDSKKILGNRIWLKGVVTGYTDTYNDGLFLRPVIQMDTGETIIGHIQRFRLSYDSDVRPAKTKEIKWNNKLIVVEI